MITNRELRQLLTQVDSQELTVRELRQVLFNLTAQDEAFDPALINQVTRKPEEVR